jgi:hypothetical protein
MADYDWAYHHARILDSRPCNSCGSPSLRLIFITEREHVESGTAVFWCNSCLRGLLPLRALVPDGGETVLRGAEAVPDYELVVDE